MSKDSPCLPNCVPLTLEGKELNELIEKARDWALMHGAAMRSRTNFNEDVLQVAPFTLLPSVFPRKEYINVIEIQTAFNELVHKIAKDKVFLTNCLKNVTVADDFTAELFNIYQIIQKEGTAQPISLGLLRCDYMLESSCRAKANVDSPARFQWKQVEFNTIASGFGWLGPVSREIQSFILQELGHGDKIDNLPKNNALSGLCGGMLEALKLYGKPEAVILFLIENVTYNICDQRFHEFEITRLNPKAKVIRRTLTQIAETGSLSSSKELLIDDLEVGVIYFRAGYEPGHYPSRSEWDARLMIERSRAIKCPSIDYHLAGAKKVQQELAKPGVVESLITDSQKAADIRKMFVGLYGLDFNEQGEEAVKMALDDPQRFVLKPQREGGCNNIYGEEIKEALEKMKASKERTAWILMEKIFPPVSTGYIVRPCEAKPPQKTEMVSELGIFGVIIGDTEKIYMNKQVGHMLRTKNATANEGGVATGLGALDSPYLIDV